MPSVRLIISILASNIIVCRPTCPPGLPNFTAIRHAMKHEGVKSELGLICLFLPAISCIGTVIHQQKKPVGNGNWIKIRTGQPCTETMRFMLLDTGIWSKFWLRNGNRNPPSGPSLNQCLVDSLLSSGRM